VKFLRDVGHRKAHVLQGRFQIGVTHHLLQDGQTHAGPRHVSAESVSKAVSIGHRDDGASSPLPKQTSEPSRGHGAATVSSLQHYEEMRLGAPPRPFQLLVLPEYVRKDLR
jgi:hypothetical protein